MSTANLVEALREVHQAYGPVRAAMRRPWTPVCLNLGHVEHGSWDLRLVVTCAECQLQWSAPTRLGAGKIALTTALLRALGCRHALLLMFDREERDL